MLSQTLRDRAERFQPAKLRPLVYNPQVRPHWIGGEDRFWYARETPDGIVPTVVDAATGATSSFDPPAPPAGVTVRPGEVLSPDGRHAAFRRGNDLWLRDTATDAERALTTDGAPHHAYAKSPDMNLTTVTLQRRGILLPAAVLWSPDSTRLLTSQLDEREVQDWPLVQHVPDDGSARPLLHPLRVALSGDPVVPLERYLVIELPTGAIVTATGPGSAAGVMTVIEREEAWWTADGRTVHFIDRDRHSRRMTLRALDVATGAMRDILTETAESFVEVNLSVTGLPNIRILDASDEFIWFSQRDGYAHLYLYVLSTGELKNRITTGQWVVRDLVHVDAASRRILFLAGGVDPAANPHDRVLCTVGLDGSGLKILTPEPGDHLLATPQKRVPRDHIRPPHDPGQFLSPSGRYFVDTWSTLEHAPVSVLRRIDGNVVSVIETAELAPSLQAAWRWPRLLRLMADDATTPLFGAMWVPTDFDSSKKYPVIDYIYPGPQRGITPTAMLTDIMGDLSRSCLPQMFAELGFIVVNIDGRGLPLRSKALHDMSYGKLDDPGMLADHVAGLRQLAKTHSFIDLTRVGIMGHSGGGYASVRAMLTHPETFHAAVATSGNHDQKGYSFGWTEKYMGPLIRNPDGTSNYDTAANPPLASRLQGKLLLAYGDMDDNVHPALTLQLVAALIAADRDFDLIVLPNDDHTTVWHNPYFLRRAMEFMVNALTPSGLAPPG